MSTIQQPGGTQLSPGVLVNEVDLTTIAPAVSTSVGAIAGVFAWGPVNTPTLVTTESQLIQDFGRPTNRNPGTFFCAASFLSYSNSLYVTRAASNASLAAIATVANTAAANTSLTIYNPGEYESKANAAPGDVTFVARWPGLIGSSLRVTTCASPTQWEQTINVAGHSGNTLFNHSNSVFMVSVGANTATIHVQNTSVLAGDTPLPYASSIRDQFQVGDLIRVAGLRLRVASVGDVLVINNSGINTGAASITLGLEQPVTAIADVAAPSIVRNWEFAASTSGPPGNSGAAGLDPDVIDEMHVAVVDAGGEITGTPGALLELYQGLSRAKGAKTVEGADNYVRSVLARDSRYVWMFSPRPGEEHDAPEDLTNAASAAPYSARFVGGADETEGSIPLGALATAWDTYKNENYDISLLITGVPRGGIAGEALPNYIIDNIAEERKDAVAFVSPPADATTEADVISYRRLLRSSSYAVMDSGNKRMIDRYNDAIRIVPLCGDVAGLCARTDSLRDPWWSPAGFERGQIRNALSLLVNVEQVAVRDALYQQSVNPVVQFPGFGPVLYGDKTLLQRPSAFDRINVRRLMIVLRKAISTAAKQFLFEFNDEFTRAQFRALVEPFLRDVQARRGIIDWIVVCDETNNTPQVIDSNRFVATIVVKPARSINFITLNIVAARTGVDFSEIVGQ